MNNTLQLPPIPAVVVGLCSHGLAIARALALQGVEVHAIEARPELPGVRTSLAKVHLVPEIRARGLIDALLHFRKQHSPNLKPVLFLTNDNMVADIAAAWEELGDSFRLSWSASRSEVNALLSKTEHERLSGMTNCLYPSNYSLARIGAANELAESLPFPVIAKPAKPLSSFKTAMANDSRELETLLRSHQDALPILAQKFIPGGDERIHFCAVYLRDGEILARFDGRKLRSRPMGHTTVAEPCDADDVFETTSRFFSATSISGPASLELKRDKDDSLWVIEPTVGRTDFWVQVCISNGVNLPWIEYCDQVGLPIPQTAPKKQYVWVNTERDPKALLFTTAGMARGSIARRRLILPYFQAGDFRPATKATAAKIRRNISSRIRRDH